MGAFPNGALLSSCQELYGEHHGAIKFFLLLRVISVN